MHSLQPSSVNKTQKNISLATNAHTKERLDRTSALQNYNFTGKQVPRQSQNGLKKFMEEEDTALQMKRITAVQKTTDVHRDKCHSRCSSQTSTMMGALRQDLAFLHKNVANSGVFRHKAFDSRVQAWSFAYNSRRTRTSNKNKKE